MKLSGLLEKWLKMFTLVAMNIPLPAFIIVTNDYDNQEF